MQTKPNIKNRDDIKVIITAIALTLTLAFWNIFSDGVQKPVQAASIEPSAPHAGLRGAAEDSVQAGAAQKTMMAQSPFAGGAPGLGMPPGGGPPPPMGGMGGPPPKTTIIISQPRVTQQRNQQSAPQPVTNTASSK